MTLKNELSELDEAVDAFAAEMKKRLKAQAKKGWRGWRLAGREDLGGRLLKNAAKGAVSGDLKSLVDAANLAMMIHQGAST